MLNFHRLTHNETIDQSLKVVSIVAELPENAAEPTSIESNEGTSHLTTLVDFIDETTYLSTLSNVTELPVILNDGSITDTHDLNMMSVNEVSELPEDFEESTRGESRDLIVNDITITLDYSDLIFEPEIPPDQVILMILDTDDEDNIVELPPKKKHKDDHSQALV